MGTLSFILFSPLFYSSFWVCIPMSDLLLSLPSDNVQGTMHSERKNCHNSWNTTNLIQSILVPCVFSVEYELSIPSFYQTITWCTITGIIMGYTLLYTPYSPCVLLRIYMPSNPPSFSLLPLAACGGLAGLACS